MDEKLLDEYIKEASRIEEDSNHSAKGHYNAADSWGVIHMCIGLPSTVLAAIAGLKAFDGNIVVAGSLAIGVAAITAVSTFLNPSDRSSTHNHCAVEYHALKNKARIFKNIDSKADESIDALRTKFEEMVSKRDDLNATSPQIPKWAFKRAKQGIDAGESDYKE